MLQQMFIWLCTIKQGLNRSVLFADKMGKTPFWTTAKQNPGLSCFTFPTVHTLSGVNKTDKILSIHKMTLTMYIPRPWTNMLICIFAVLLSLIGRTQDATCLHFGSRISHPYFNKLIKVFRIICKLNTGGLNWDWY